MSIHATGQFTVKSWDEKPYDEFGEGSKLARARVTQSFSGDIEGEGFVEYLMVYANEAFAHFVGVQRIVGRVGGRSGSFVLQLSGVFDGSKAQATWTVVPGAATGDLRRIRGEGSFSAPLGETASLILDYELA
jgi:hypothetical protein